MKESEEDKSSSFPFATAREVDEVEEDKSSSSPTEALAEVKKRVFLFAFASAWEVEKKVI